MADYVKKRTHIINHPRFLEAGAVARDLYDWGMLWSGQLETDGEIPMAALLASPWGAGQKKNVVVAQKLVDVGLWERTDVGYRICKWAEQGNVTKAQLEEQRQAARERMRSRRSAKHPPPCSDGVRENFARSDSEVPTSLSTSPSLSGSSGRDPEPDRSSMPAWFSTAAETVAMTIGGSVDELPSRWASYAASRDRKGWAKNHGDAVGWLSDVVRRERREVSSRSRRNDSRQPVSDATRERLLKAASGDDF